MFDRTGKCPICHKPFQSKECKHTYDYVHSVMSAAKKDNFGKDVKELKIRLTR